MITSHCCTLLPLSPMSILHPLRPGAPRQTRRLHPRRGALQARRLARGQAHLHALEGLRLWQLGKVYEQITNANPRLFKKFNYRVVWADTAKGPTSLRVENYAHGSDAALDSWVVLERKEGGAGGAE